MLPKKDKRVRKCVAVMDPALVSASSVSCAGIGQNEVQMDVFGLAIMLTLLTLGFTLSRNAAAHPPGWVSHPVTTACFVVDSLSLRLASMFGTVMKLLPLSKKSPKQ